jgi:hypothetical protein
MAGLDEGGQGPTSGCCAIEEEEFVMNSIALVISYKS